jgi:hypothetical protein
MMRDVIEQDPTVGRDPPEVLHTHVRHSSNLRPAVYVIRDGRDVAVSMYFYQVRHLRQHTPMQGARAHRNFTYLYGPNYDVDDVKGNLPKYVANLSSRSMGVIVGRRRGTRFRPWPDHIRDWIDRDGILVAHYEDFLDDSVGQLERVSGYLNMDVPRPELEEIVDDHSFQKVTGRRSGEEDRSSFFRKGVAGDWREYFTPEAAKAFHEFAGDVLIELGYEEDDSWVASLAT